MKKENKVIKAYKGFDKNLKCRGFQYEIGKEYKHDGEVKACESGFHACENPLDVLGYYSPNESRYCMVEQSGTIDKSESDKTCSEKIKIGAELSLKDIVTAAIKFTFDKSTPENSEHATGYKGASSATGYYGASSATGYCGASSATGDCGASSATGNCGASSATGYKGASSATGYKGASSATGDCGASSATGDYGASSATGYKGASSATGDKGASSATGDYGASSATGDKGASSATGDYGASSATGNYGASLATGNCGASSATGYKGASSATGNCGASLATGNCGASSATGNNSIALAAGYQCKAKGAIGCWLCIADREDWNGETYPIKEVRAVKVDGERIKADTWYKLVSGEFKEIDL